MTAIANNGLAVGDIVYVSGATPPQYDGAMVVQSATATSFTYTLASGLNLAAATGTITAGAPQLTVSSLAYNNTSGLVTAAANNGLVNTGNNAIVAGSIVHVSGVASSQYDGTFVVQSASASGFTYALASGLNLAADTTDTITAGLNDVWFSLGTYAASGTLSVELTRTADGHPSEWTVAGGMELVDQRSRPPCWARPRLAT